MTTAHRATFNPAVGGNDQGANRLMVPTRQYSARDIAGYTKLHVRQKGQNNSEDILDMDYKEKLISKEHDIKKKSKKEQDDLNAQPDIPTIRSLDTKQKLNIGQGEDNKVHVYKEDADDDSFCDSSSDEDEKKPSKQEKMKNLAKQKDSSKLKITEPKDDEASDQDEEESEKSGSSDSDDEDELLMEYERLKKEREEKENREKEQIYENLTSKQEEEILKGNPILDSSYSLKKRWYEETPFRNQSLTEPKDKKRFINDTVRSDFHKSFLKKFIWT